MTEKIKIKVELAKLPEKAESVLGRAQCIKEMENLRAELDQLDKASQNPRTALGKPSAIKPGSAPDD